MISTKGNKFFVIYFHIKPFRLKDINDLKNFITQGLRALHTYGHDRLTSGVQQPSPFLELPFCNFCSISSGVLAIPNLIG